jgi:hypothetical protein
VIAGGVVFAAVTADMAGISSGEAPVMADRNWRLRDPKFPTIGPEKYDPVGTLDRVEHRYLYDDKFCVARETYRLFYTDLDSGYRRRDYWAPEVRRFVERVPGSGQTLLFVDADGTIDVNFVDRDGRRWWTWAIEPEVLLGRRGTLGWKTHRYDAGPGGGGVDVDPLQGAGQRRRAVLPGTQEETPPPSKGLAGPSPGRSSWPPLFRPSVAARIGSPLVIRGGDFLFYP